jgi:hypothetical protein
VLGEVVAQNGRAGVGQRNDICKFQVERFLFFLEKRLSDVHLHRN